MTIYWESVGEFLAMGGYGFYVWGAFGVTAVAMLAELFILFRQSRRRVRSPGR